MEITYRALKHSEIGEATEVFLTTLAELARRNGLSAPASYTHRTIEPLYAHLFETGIFRVAEANGRIVSICSAVVRDRLWFLAMYWTLPELQQKKVGGPLLRQVWEEGRRQGTNLCFTWSSIDYAAMATYMKLGMLPGSQIFTFAGKPTALPAQASGYDVEPLEQEHAMHIDVRVRSTARAADHEFWHSGASVRRQLRTRGEIVGYFYASDGVIGPAAWTEPAHARALLSYAIRHARTQNDEVKLMTPGTNHSAITLALESGLRLGGSAHLLLSQPLGQMDRYLPSGPGLF